MKDKPGILKKLNNKNITLVLVIIAIVIFYRSFNRHYLTANNIMTILNSASVFGTLAVGLTLLFISGQIDLSPASVGCFSGVFITLILGDGASGLAWPVALLVTLGVGAVSGLVVAFFVNILNISAFITTIAMASVYQGLARHFSNTMTLPVRNQSYWGVGASIGVIPIPFLIMIALYIIYGVILARTKFGRRIYICGGNPSAARLAGINTKKMHTILFINNGAVAALAGALLAARMRSAGYTSVLGNEIDAITAVILGGVAFTGGRGTMLGSFIGMMLLSTFKNGLIGLSLPTYAQIIAQGAILVLALSVDFLRERSQEKALKARA